MGYSVYPVLGRLRIFDYAGYVLSEISRARPPRLKPEMFEFQEVDGFLEKDKRGFSSFIGTNRDLFSWLSDTGHRSVEPFLGIDGVSKRIYDSIGFTRWINDYTEEKFAKSHFVHDSDTLYSLDELLAVDYNKVAYGCFDSSDRSISGFHPEGKTLRQLFDDSGYFEFLREAKEKGWEFIVFQYS